MARELPEPHVLLQDIIRSMVDEPEKVDVEYQMVGQTAVFEVNVAYNDARKVIGRRGAYADALRAIFGAIYGKHRQQLKLQVVDPRR